MILYTKINLFVINYMPQHTIHLFGTKNDKNLQISISITSSCKWMVLNLNSFWCYALFLYLLLNWYFYTTTIILHSNRSCNALSLAQTFSRPEYVVILLNTTYFDCVKSVRTWSCSGLYFPAFGLNTGTYSVSLRIQFECRKYGPE